MKLQFGSTTGVGCQYDTFTIKTLIHLRKNHNLPTCVALTYLVKAFDTSNHALIITILGKYGTPPRLCSAIKRMYDKSIVNLIIGKVETSLELKSGCQTRIHHGPGNIYVLNDGLRQNTGRRVDRPGTKKIPIFMQRQLTNINRTISDPPTRNLLVWNAIRSILNALYRR